MKRIMIAPFAAKLKNGKRNPKNYPYWEEVVELLKKEYSEIIIEQIGVTGERVLNGISEITLNAPLNTVLLERVKSADVIITVESFLFHYCAYYGIDCIVIWGQSDPNIFGYEYQTNILKSRKYLRKNQFADFFSDGNIVYNKEVFAEPEKVVEIIIDKLGRSEKECLLGQQQS